MCLVKRLPHWLVRTFQSLPRRVSRRGARPAPLGFETLESRDVPTASAPWVQFHARNHDPLDRLILQLLPGTHNGLQFFERLNGWIYHSMQAGGGTNQVHSANNPDGYLNDMW